MTPQPTCDKAAVLESRRDEFAARVQRILARHAGANLDDPEEREALAEVITRKLGPR